MNNVTIAGTEFQVAVDAPGEYELVAASQTNQALGNGAGGAKGDVIDTLVCVVSTAATSAVSIKDGADTAIQVLPNAVGGGIGTYVLKLNVKSRTGAWQVTTGAGVAVLALGQFTD
jgi:hypothetical protein